MQKARGRGVGRGGGRRWGRGSKRGREAAPAQEATKKHKPNREQDSWGATTANTYIHAALDALQSHNHTHAATSTNHSTAEATALAASRQHLRTALQCLSALRPEGDEHTGGGEEDDPRREAVEEGQGSSSSTGAGLAIQQLPGPLTHHTEGGEPPIQLAPTTAQHTHEGTANFEEAIRLAIHVGQGWEQLTLEERVQDIGAKGC